MLSHSENLDSSTVVVEDVVDDVVDETPSPEAAAAEKRLPEQKILLGTHAHTLILPAENHPSFPLRSQNRASRTAPHPHANRIRFLYPQHRRLGEASALRVSIFLPVAAEKVASSLRKQ